LLSSCDAQINWQTFEEARKMIECQERTMTRAHESTSVVNRRNFASGLAALPTVGLLAAARTACAQAKYPTRSPRLVLPFAAGGVADVTARIVAEKLGEKLGHRLIVDNQPGAGGINAANQMRSARYGEKLRHGHGILREASFPPDHRFGQRQVPQWVAQPSRWQSCGG